LGVKGLKIYDGNNFEPLGETHNLLQTDRFTFRNGETASNCED
jgi:hypothetical protein